MLTGTFHWPLLCCSPDIGCRMIRAQREHKFSKILGFYNFLYYCTIRSKIHQAAMDSLFFYSPELYPHWTHSKIPFCLQDTSSPSHLLLWFYCWNLFMLSHLINQIEVLTYKKEYVDGKSASMDKSKTQGVKGAHFSSITKTLSPEKLVSIWSRGTLGTNGSVQKFQVSW